MCTINQLKASSKKRSFIFKKKDEKEEEENRANYSQFSSHFSISMPEKKNLKKIGERKEVFHFFGDTTFISCIYFLNSQGIN